MAGTSEVIWGHFCFEDGRQTLRDVISDQTLQLTRTSAGPEHHFRYRDPDLDASIVVSVIGESTLEVDFNNRHMRDVADDYALWRRLAFFLPDALPVWLCDAAGSHLVRLLGGWQNAVWKPSFALTSTTGHVDLVSGTGRNAPHWSERITLFPLDSGPLTWHYVAPLSVAPVVELKTIPGAVPRLDKSVSLESQLVHAPRFVRQDGNAALFHQKIVQNFMREDHYPEPYYGYVNRKAAFTFCSSSWLGISRSVQPALVGADTPAGYFEEFRSTPAGLFADLSLDLREELLFALIDIQDAMPSAYDLPTIRKEDHSGYAEIIARNADEASWMSDIVFGRYLDWLRDTPRRSPFGYSDTRFKALKSL